MIKKRRAWTREELILTFNLYCKIEFSKINYRHPLIVSLAEILDRTPSAVSWKLVNFASLDSELTQRGIKGAINSSKLDKKIFNEFTQNWGKLAEESELLLCTFKRENENIFSTPNLQLKLGEDKLRVIKTRVNQSFFREAVLSSYSFKCCLTGIDIPELLIASHIIPWSQDTENRLNPQNGLCLNSLHDKAFDRGFITFDDSYKLVLSEKLKKKQSKYFIELEGQKITLPKKFLPNINFLKFHREEIFQG